MNSDTIPMPTQVAPASQARPATAGSAPTTGRRRWAEPLEWLIDLPVIVICVTGATAAVMGSGRWSLATLAVYVALTAAAVAWARPVQTGLSARLRQGLTAPWDVIWFAFLTHALGRGARGKFTLVLMVGCVIAATVQGVATDGPWAIVTGVAFLHVVAVRPVLKYL